MNELIIDSNGGTMSSLEIAQLTDRNHKDVMRSIREMEPAWIKINGRDFALVEYKDSKGEMRPCYELTKTECLYIATKFNDEARAKLVLRWEQLETEKKKLSRKDLALMVIQSEEERERLQLENIALKEEYKQAAPAVAFTNAVQSSNSSCLIGELAKLIAQNGYEIGEKRLFKWLRERGYLGQHGERYNIPNQQYIEQGLFELKKGVRSGSGGVLHTTITTKVTGKGQVYFVNKFLSAQTIAS